MPIYDHSLQFMRPLMWLRACVERRFCRGSQNRHWEQKILRLNFSHRMNTTYQDRRTY